MVAGREVVEVKIDDPEKVWCYSNHTIGNGLYHDIYDIIYVDPETFALKDSGEIAPK